MAWKDPVERFLELLRLRTVSSEGPNGSYNEVRGLHCGGWREGSLTAGCCNVCASLAVCGMAA